MSSDRKQIIGGLIFLAISLFYGWNARKISLFFLREGQVFTARTIPYALSLLGIGFSFLYLMFPVIRLLRGRHNTNAKESQQSGISNPDKKTVLILLALMLVYVALFPLLGFIVSTIIFLASGFYVLGVRSIKALVIVPLGFVLVFWLLVGVLLNIHLLSGRIWGW